ncbi:MAG TPA: acyl-CoA dehydrogenase family protein [Candidatus Dormibacteraeota bacterium]
MAGFLPDNTWSADATLQSLLKRWLPGSTYAAAEPALSEMGRAAASELQAWGDQCEQQPAALRSFDGWGNRRDEIVYPEGWGKIGAASARAGLVGLPYEPESVATLGPEVRVVQAALCYLFAPSTATYLCPVAMTDGAARVLVDTGDRTLRETFTHLSSRDPETAWTSGQWMTERQGGSDVGRNAVIARPENGSWRLFGQKFFCSNIGCEVALALARPEGAPPGTRGLALFLVPRDRADGSRNAYRIDRLKDKLGTRAMATGEVTLDGAEAQLVGPIDRGFAQMTAMLNITRLHNAITAAALIRRAWMLAATYATQREAFGRPLDQHPLHREVLDGIAREADGALALTMRMAQLLGRIECGSASEQDASVFRLGIALAKLYTAKQAVANVSEAIECFGGQGYMEDTGLPRLLRDAQVLPIWEGTTNILSLDALRVLTRPPVLEAIAAELDRLEAPEREAAIDQARKASSTDDQASARRVAYALARSWMGGLTERA